MAPIKVARADERKLLRMMARYGIAEFVYSGPGWDVELTLESRLHPEIICRQAGRFLHDHPADRSGPAFPRHVRKGEIVAYLKIGALLMSVTASEDGWLPSPLIEHGAIAGYGDVLF
jgi:hypothetical protein